MYPTNTKALADGTHENTAVIPQYIFGCKDTNFV